MTILTKTHLKKVMTDLFEDYYKIWENDSFTLEATVVRSLWDDRVIENFESKLNKALIETFKSSKAVF